MAEKLIRIYDIVNGPAAIATEDGEKLFAELSDMLSNADMVILDFEKINTLTTTFLHAAIGQLYRMFDSPFLQAHMKVVNMSQEDKAQLRKVVERAPQYFKDKQSIEKPVQDVMDEEHDN
jgi:hypothetical protein